MIARIWGAGALLVVLVGCSSARDDGGYRCAEPDKAHIGPDGKPDPCHQESGAGGDPGCVVGRPVHWKYGWESPSLLWIGPVDEARECPHGPASVAYEGRTDLVAPSTCEACTCEAPSGACTLPSTLTASTAVCGTPGATTPFDAPGPWDGQCDATNQVPAGIAHSLTIGALTMTESGCATGPTLPAKVVSLYWDTFARACDMPWPDGPLARTVCIPDEPIPTGFGLCIFHEGEMDCPTESGNVFTEQHIFYEGVEDDRLCSACTCGLPVGGACTAMISIYTGGDQTCSGPALATNAISSASPTCIDIQLPGQALVSKSAGPTTYLPGACPATGGVASGAAVKTTPSTFCCRP